MSSDHPSISPFQDLEVIESGVRVTLLLNTSRDERWLSRLRASDLSLLRLRVTSGVSRDKHGAADAVVRNISILHHGVDFAEGGGIGGGNGQTALGKSEKLPLLQVNGSGECEAFESRLRP